jgi:hypothetical protein
MALTTRGKTGRTAASDLAKGITLMAPHLRPRGSVGLGPANHPTTNEPGELVYFPKTRRYALSFAGATSPVPQEWARCLHRERQAAVASGAAP